MSLSKTRRWKINLTDEEYKIIRHASMSVKFNHRFERDPKTGDVTFITTNTRKLCKELDDLLEFGAITAWEAIGADDFVAKHGQVI